MASIGPRVEAPKNDQKFVDFSLFEPSVMGWKYHRNPLEVTYVFNEGILQLGPTRVYKITLANDYLC